MCCLPFNLFLHFLCFSASLYAVTCLNSDGKTLLSLLSHWEATPPCIESTWNASHSDPCSWAGVKCDRKAEFVVALNLSSFGISGHLGPEIADLKHLRFIDLSHNSLFGPIPSEIGSQLEGPLPSSLCKLENLKFLRLVDNRFTGTIPNCFGNMNKLTSLELGLNDFHGVIPQNFSKENALENLSLKGNQLEGPLPSSLCKLENLVSLCLSHNKLTGTILYCLGNMSNIAVLDLKNNGFRGMIPTHFPEGNTLQILDFNSNHLEGPLPISLLNCRRLSILDVGRNNIRGAFPSWLGTLPRLYILILKWNNFHGTIGITSKSSFQMLQVLDISYNQFGGFLPADMIDGFQAMKEEYYNPTLTVPKVRDRNSAIEYYVTLVIKGIEFELSQLLALYTSIDLSGNRFEGSIPKSIGELTSLHILNFSHNLFGGVIPSTIGNMSALESLDLSWNQLGGNIPAELANLNFLEALNLSHNRLVGRIPTNPQLSTFTISSYDGNSGLCGFPLEDCEKVPKGKQVQSPPSGIDFMNGLTWESVLLGFGFGLIVGLLMGGLMFYTEKPNCFHATVEDLFIQFKGARKKNASSGAK